MTTGNVTNQSPLTQKSDYESLVFPFECINRSSQNKVLVSLFSDLESNNADIVRKAKKVFESLFAYGYTLRELVILSLPLWPVNLSKIKQIAMDQSESENPTIIERVRIATSYLRCQEGYETIAFLASKKLHHPNTKVQQEGLLYFSMLLNQFQPVLATEDLEIAINIASEMLESNEDKIWLPANTFFEKLINHGKEDDVLKIKMALLNACASKRYSLAFERCDEIITKHAKSKELISIPLEAAIKACESDKSWIREKAFSIFWKLLRLAPEYSMDTIIQGILMESKRPDPCIRIIGRLNELAGHDFSNVFCRGRDVILNRAEKDSASLLEALNNLSFCESKYMREHATYLKGKMESRLQSRVK